MKLGLEVSGGLELSAALLSLSTAVRRRALYGVLRPAAVPMQMRMAQIAGAHSRTGELASTMTISAATRIGSVAGGQWQAADEFQAAVAVGPAKHVFYAIFQEYGTVHQTANPFGRPSFDSQYEESLDIIRQGLWALLQEAAEKRGHWKESA